jgi:multidrug resistance efflux pump
VNAAAPKRSPAPLVLAALLLISLAAYGAQRWRVAHSPFEWSGTIEARTASLGSRAGGRVKEVRVLEGARVTQGQVLVVLEAGDYPAQLMQATAALTQARASLDKLRAGARPEEIDAAKARAQSAQAMLAEAVAGARSEEIARARAALTAKEVAVAQAQRNAERMRKLDASGAAIPADVETAESALKGAIAERDATKSQLAELTAGSRRETIAQARARAAEQNASERLVTAGTRQEDLVVAEAQVQAAEGRVQQIQTMIDELEIKAPADGRIEALDLRPGDIIGPSATAVTLVEDNQLYVRIYIPETEIGHVALDQKVAISVDSFPKESFPGIVQHISSVGEYSPRNLQTADERADQVFAARVGIEGGMERLRAGMAATIRVARE